jgi:hypothetical protein
MGVLKKKVKYIHYFFFVFSSKSFVLSKSFLRPSVFSYYLLVNYVKKDDKDVEWRKKQ